LRLVGGQTQRKEETNVTGQQEIKANRARLIKLLQEMYKIPKEVAEAITFEDCDTRSYDNADNLCVARIAETEEFKEYKAKREKGCCAFRDRITFDDEGNAWAWGFNFGH
jgi:hypothetical protein